MSGDVETAPAHKDGGDKLRKLKAETEVRRLEAETMLVALRRRDVRLARAIAVSSLLGPQANPPRDVDDPVG